jgi:hypothetical protein
VDKQARAARQGHPAGRGARVPALTPLPGQPMGQDVVQRPTSDWCAHLDARAVARLLDAVASLGAEEATGPGKAGTAQVVDLAAYRCRRTGASERPQRRPRGAKPA